MMISQGVSTILNGEVTVCFNGTLSGRHRALGSSLLSVSLRLLYSTAAQGWNGTSSGFMSAAMLIMYLVELPIQIPVRLGLPSALRGVGADRLVLPSGVLGVSLVGYLSHCAGAGEIAASSRQTPRSLRDLPRTSTPESSLV